MRKRILTVLSALAILSWIAATPSAAQEQTFRACYVPDVGALYLIGLSGLPTECLSSEHVEVSWTEGGGGVSNHDELTGLSADDHPQYLLADGTRALAGDLSVGGNRLTDLGAATTAGDAVRFEQAVKVGDAATGDLAGTFPDPSVAGLQGNAVSSTAPSDGQVLTWNGSNTAWEPQTAASGVTDHGNLTGLTADDHTQYLLTDGVREATDGFAVTGSSGVGTIPVEGSGSRVMWYPAKNAFRAGAVSGSEWDEANIGFNSTALGIDVTASGVGTTAIGVGATADAPTSGAISIGLNTSATGDASFALGGGTEATGAGSTAIGFSTVASGPYALAMGRETEATTTEATAMGSQTTASGLTSTAMGDQTTASGTASTAMGSQTAASGVTSVAMGGGTTASGNGAVAMGGATAAHADNSVAMGLGTIADIEGGLVVGRYNVPQAGNPNAPRFMVGNGTSATNRSLAMVVEDDGHVFIAGSLAENSDARLKTEIEPLGPALDALQSIRPVRFRFREGTGHPSDAQIGLIAQEVQRAFPELVNRDSEGYLSLAYPKLTAVLVRAIQEQQAQLAEREGVLERLLQRVDRLETILRSRSEE